MLYTVIIMLVLRNSIIDRPVMSLRTGRQVATAVAEIINPNNLKIEGFYCIDSIDKKKRLVLLYQDIRDVLPAGLIIDDHEVLSEPDELIRLQKTMELEFELLGKTVVSENKKRLGKVSDYALEPQSMLVKKIYVAQSLIKNFTGGTLSIDRTQIIEITNKKIVVKDPLQPVKSKTSVPLLNTAPAS